VHVLVLNVGSSSIKASIVESVDSRAIAATEVSLGSDATARAGFDRTVREVVRRLEVEEAAVQAVGHRVVHGGTKFRSAVRVNDRVLKGIEDLAEFAPLHNRLAASAIRAARRALPDLPQVACFDTAFHASLSEEQFTYPVPWRWRQQYGIRRYGFHGLSVEWSMREASRLLARPAGDLALIVAHLGSGCSVTAVLDGRSVSTSMGLTPMEGLMMGTRSGSIDPGILIYMLRTRRAGWRELEQALDHQSGLAGISGRKAGMRELQQAADRGNVRASLAIDMFVGRTAAAIAAAGTSLPRVDALIFTGGIGQHSDIVRHAVTDRLGTVAIEKVLTVEAREDAVVAAQVQAASRSA
jgi:acetate kinase